MTAQPRGLAGKINWLPIAGLLVLSIVPALAGGIRLGQLATGAEITPQNARFFAAPVPVVLHIVSAIVYSVLGAFQFSAGVRRRYLRWHRIAGRVLVPMGLVAALSGLWMSQFYPHVEGDGPLLYWFRLFFGGGMVLSILLGFYFIMQRNVPEHRAWMMRGYAIGIGAGTQVVVYLPWILVLGTPDPVTRDLLMAAGWVINLAVAEWLIRRDRMPALGAPVAA